MTARAQHHFSNFNSAESAAGSADTVTASFQPPAPDAVAGYVSISGGDDDSSLPSGESEPSVRLAYAPSEFSSESTVDANPDHGRLAAAADQDVAAAFSFPESAGPLAGPRVTAGDTGALRILGVSSPAGFPIPAIPYAKLQARHRFDQYFDPDGFLAAIEQKSQPHLLHTLFQLAGDKP